MLWAVNLHNIARYVAGIFPERKDLLRSASSQSQKKRATPCCVIIALMLLRMSILSFLLTGVEVCPRIGTQLDPQKCEPHEQISKSKALSSHASVLMRVLIERRTPIKL